MPFRHLLFNRRNGAPQRPPDQQPVSLESQRYFSLDNEFPQASYNNEWSDAQNYTAQSTPLAAYDQQQMTHNPQLMKQQTLAYNQPFDHTSMFPYNTVNGVPYQNSPYDFDSHSLQYSSDMMDTDGSSISQGSVHSSMSSTTHLDVMLDDDVNGMHSLSRKPSVISNYSSYGSETQSEKLCPLITGQVHKCAPDICGPSAPCLQYVNDEVVVPPIEECVPELKRRSSSNPFQQDQNQPTDFTTPHNSPPRQRQRREQTDSTSSVNPAQTLQTPPADDEKVKATRTRRTITKSATTDDVPLSKQTKKSRARQAHSLVERKYRENLNAKIQELHVTLQKTHFGKPCSHTSSRHHTHSPDEDEDDADDLDSRSSKVKKSDVLIEAMNYVHSTEMELRRKDEEISQLHDRIKMMETWMRTGSMGQRGMM
ncbi:hypothetical protein PMZ80_004152 [Knufia obscura]|uniref:BHLH domain-containing protein n=1 Tax=Knufia obscura TaxID=1635080 RepID=A0ABR0RR81_9EURO|nr:hypothetical protein PMZ80_004152 [Knufia obscura]